MATIRYEREGGGKVDEIAWQAQELKVVERPNGPAAAAMIAGAIGVLVLGFLTTLNEASTDAHDFLEFWKNVGPLSGKTLIAVGAFLGSWLVLAPLLWRRNVALNTVLLVTALLIAGGFIGTFPKFFELFA